MNVFFKRVLFLLVVAFHFVYFNEYKKNMTHTLTGWKKQLFADAHIFWLFLNKSKLSLFVCFVWWVWWLCIKFYNFRYNIQNINSLYLIITDGLEAMLLLLSVCPTELYKYTYIHLCEVHTVNDERIHIFVSVKFDVFVLMCMRFYTKFCRKFEKYLGSCYFYTDERIMLSINFLTKIIQHKGRMNMSFFCKFKSIISCQI